MSSNKTTIKITPLPFG